MAGPQKKSLNTPDERIQLDGVLTVHLAQKGPIEAANAGVLSVLHSRATRSSVAVGKLMTPSLEFDEVLDV